MTSHSELHRRLETRARAAEPSKGHPVSVDRPEFGFLPPISAHAARDAVQESAPPGCDSPGDFAHHYHALLLQRQQAWLAQGTDLRARLYRSWREGLLEIEAERGRLEASTSERHTVGSEVDERRRQLEELIEQYRAAAPVQLCPCCRAYDLAKAEHDPRSSHSGAEQRARRAAASYATPVFHDSDLKYDPETCITTATEEVAYTGVPADAVGRLLFLSDPRNWDEVADQTFFESVEPGAWEDGEFRTFSKGSSEYEDWCKNGEPGKVLEKVAFQWNPSSDGTGIAENVLNISSLKRLGHDHDPLRKGAHITGSSALLEYDYSLYVCVRTKYSVATVYGGLDVDEGHFRAEWRQTSADGVEPRLGTLEVKAHKSVHYTQPEGTPAGLGTTLNLAAPSLTSLLMRELVYVGTRQALLPPTGARTAD